jgi:hypothetical protein
VAITAKISAAIIAVITVIVFTVRWCQGAH